MLIDDVTALYKGESAICGVDEAGRGPLAGPVCAAAVILPESAFIDGLDDSKKLSGQRRERLFDVIRQTAVAYAVGYAAAQEIEELNILNATMLAMRRAVAELGVVPGIALIDGDKTPGGLPCPAEAVIKGDGRCAAIAAASVLAKVSRDRLMAGLDASYPGYGFARHKGYGTAAHIEAIRKLGLCELHRRGFIKEAWLRG